MTVDARRILKLAMFALLVLSALMPLTACSSEEPVETQPTETQSDEPAEPAEDTAEEPAEAPAAEIAWADIELTNVETGEAFKISEFTEGTVLIQAFAVW